MKILKGIGSQKSSQEIQNFIKKISQNVILLLSSPEIRGMELVTYIKLAPLILYGALSVHFQKSLKLRLIFGETQ